ncbi:MAG: purine-nucleoside phosphorylase [Ignavibacteriae bacterium]|nr:MAG: purine-nucleoside phosphorylase [Ignavibacteriota bacterium]
MVDLNFKYKNLISFIKNEMPFEPEFCLVLGSGLGDFADKIKIEKSIPTNTIPDYPSSTVQGHKGFLHFAELFNKKTLLFQGRIHFYEGYNLNECILPAYISYQLNSKKLLLTNAAGGVNLSFAPGDLMLTTNFYSFNIKKELSTVIGTPNVEQLKKLGNLPDKNFNALIRKSSLESDVYLKEGSYWFCKGPTYETPAEIKMLSKFGIDAVGMSTVHEAIYGAYHGLEVASISLITNFAAGLSPQKLSHQEVIETAELAKAKFESLVKSIIKNI